LERASDAAVLFADDAHCMAMLDFIKAGNACLVSLHSGVEKLRGSVGQKTAYFCVLEIIEQEEWIVLYGSQQALPVMRVSSIPATMDGTARFNVSNAMHAIASSYLAGIDIEKIRTAMGSFKAGYDLTPGRLNVFDGLPFRVIMDYAHNADGFRKLSEFVDGQIVTGRKILMLGFSADRMDADIEAAVAPLSGHFDHYVCRNFRRLKHRQAHEIPALLKSGLIYAGVSESDIDIVPEADEAVRHSLAIAAPGDLVVLLVGGSEFRSTWELLASMAALAKDSS
jgi:cyanophycin synthetase